eukprot:Awhi_evm1s1675
MPPTFAARRRRNQMPSENIVKNLNHIYYVQNFQEDDEMLANLLMNTKMTGFKGDFRNETPNAMNVNHFQ